MLNLSNIPNNSTIHIPGGCHLIPEPIVLRGQNIRIIGQDGTELHASMALQRSDFTEISPGV